ncbi:MAG: amino acid permease C-terminal domain-containing protein, partial [Bacteroidota bacterium]
CGGVLLLPKKDKEPGKFHLVYINSRYLFPIIVLFTFMLVHLIFPNYFASLLDLSSEGVNLTLNISSLVFWLLLPVLSIFAFFKEWSLIPLLGLSTCMYLLTGMSASNWFWFVVWFGFGLIIYFLYGYKRSRLALEGK